MYVFESFWSKDRKNLYIDANDKNKIKLFYYYNIPDYKTVNDWKVCMNPY